MWFCCSCFSTSLSLCVTADMMSSFDDSIISALSTSSFLDSFYIVNIKPNNINQYCLLNRGYSGIKQTGTKTELLT